MNFKSLTVFSLMAVALCLSSCKDDDKVTDSPDSGFHGPEGMPDWFYAGGKLGTSYLFTQSAFEQPTVPVEQNFYYSFKRGEALFEKPFMDEPGGVRGGLGPVYVRSSCQHCHPSYSHGQSVEAGQYKTTYIGNGTLLVVYNPETNAYVTWLAGMPQLHATYPFKAPLDESKITVTWTTIPGEFPDGEKYELQYPTVTMPREAVYAYNQGTLTAEQMGNYDVLLESTIGIFGTGLLDAIPEDSIIEQWRREEGHTKNGLNTAYFENGQWKGYYANKLQGNGTPYVRRFTYAMSRGPLQDGAGANAIWNITNVTRSDRRYHYLDLDGKVYATAASKDPEVQAGFADYIALFDPNNEHPEWRTADVEANICNYLTSKELPIEMTDQEYTDLMVWHRGLAVPAVRNHDDPQVLRGKELFSQIGCDKCHRPSWTTGDDHVQDPNLFFKNADKQLPRYPNQKIWPYTDMVQHKLHMKNDIRTGWCRTTPLWGRGLHQKVTGDPSAARLHDTRARNALEAIMWHGYSTESDAYECIELFKQLPSADRKAICAFVDAI